MDEKKLSIRNLSVSFLQGNSKVTAVDDVLSLIHI